MPPIVSTPAHFDQLTAFDAEDVEAYRRAYHEVLSVGIRQDMGGLVI